MEQQYGDFDIFPKELKFLIFRRLDSCSLGRLLQLNKAYSKVVDNLGIWKYICLSQWELSAEHFAKLLAQALSNKIDWKREYRILEEYSKRVYNNQIIIRSADSGLVKQIDEDPNSLHYHAFTDANMDAKAVSAQGKFKLYPLPQVNFCVAYYEVRVENFGPDEPIVGIGLALDKYVRAMPGWGKDSYGLHSDDGCFFNQRSFGMQFCEPWHQGDTFGLGINYATKELFVTKNGVLLGTMASKVRNLVHMYPTVGIKRVDNKCRVNFGQQPFEFDIVHYLQELDKTETIKSKWLSKLYSEIIQEFETQLLDSEDPKEVEAELIAATDYYEKLEPVAVVEQNVEDDLDNREELFDWLLSKHEVLQTESTVKAVEANRPEIKTMLMSLVNGLELNIDENQPLVNILNLVKDRLLVVLASNFVDYISEKRTKRRAEEAKNPDLKKKRTFLELNQINEENLLLLLIDREFPDNHMLIRAVIFSYTHIHSLEMPQVITMQERVDVCLIMAFQRYTMDRVTKAGQDRIKRQKSYQKQHQVNGSFSEIYGPSPFFEEITTKSDSAAENTKPAVAYSEEDKFAAQRYAMLMSFGSTLFGEGLDANSLQGALLLLWWYLAMEEPYDPRDSLNSFKDSCIEKINEEIEYWESSQAQWEEVLRGSYGTLVDHKEEVIVTTMTRAWGEFIDIMKKSPDMEGKDPVEILMIGLTQVMADPAAAFAAIKKFKEERGAKQEQDGKSKKKTTAKLSEQKSWKSVLVAVASFTVSVGLVAGIAFFLRKKWNK